ncbi:MAG: ELWxxDGT repeat protein, partial [Thermoanaerobaculia bacterium]
DVNPGLRAGAMVPFLNVGGALYFAGDDGAHGAELWKTDGTAAGTAMVADLQPGAGGSTPIPWLDLGNGRLLLVADDGAHGREPFLSDGTAAGTALLKDINPSTAGSSEPVGLVGFEPSALALGGGSFLFAADDGVHGTELWKSDGTGAGTAMLKEIEPGAGGSNPYGFISFAGKILFGAFESSVYWELWQTDGTEAGTTLLKDINTDLNSSSFPRRFTIAGSTLFFEANSAAEGREAWKTDGTAAGTVLVKDINPGPLYGILLYGRSLFRALGSEVYFFGYDGDHGQEVWKSDGTDAGTVRVKDVEPGPGFGVGYGYSGLTVLGSEVYFHGVTTAHGLELWKTDGTGAGTVEVRNVSTVQSGMPVFNGYLFGTLLGLNGKLLFNADDGATGPEPWVTDGTAAGTQLLVDFFALPEWSSEFQVATFNGVNLLTPRDTGGIWTTDATPAGTSPLFPGGSPAAASGFTPALGTLFFAGYDAGDAEPWKTDGTAAGTSRILDIKPGPGSSSPFGFTPAGSAVVFAASDAAGRELWRTDGTPAGTYALTASTITDVGGITRLGSAALFTANVPGSGKEPCRTDGTLPGTILLKDVRAGAASSDPGPLAVLGSRALFIALEDATGREYWVSDGTAAGTTLLKDINPGAGSGPLEYSTWNRGNTTQIVGSAFFFLADDGTHGFELWKTDGTPAGTAMMGDIFPGARSSDIDCMTAVGSRLFFVADDGVHGRELWVSDGTAGGTHLVKDVVPGLGSPVIQDLAAAGSLALFSADDGVHGREMWRSNGTAVGTFQVQDIAPGAAPSSPMGFFPLGGQVYFAANDNVTGFELWKVPSASLLATFQDVPADYWAWPFIEALTVQGVTSGCAAGSFCPSSPVTRAEAAVFLLASRGGAVPPATGTRFQDVPLGYWAGPWIEELANEGIAGGCSASPPMFCPGANLTRAEMAVMLLATRGITPPPATGTVFADVPVNHWAAPWIEELARQGVTGGCGGGNYCPGQPVTRAEMAVFLVVNFGLPLP